MQSDEFTLSADYDNDETANLPKGSLMHIGTFKVGPPIPLPAGEDKAKLKVKVHINLHGILAVESVQAVEETTIVEEAPAPPPEAAAPKAAEDGAEATADAPPAEVRPHVLPSLSRGDK